MGSKFHHLFSSFLLFLIASSIQPSTTTMAETVPGTHNITHETKAVENVVKALMGLNYTSMALTLGMTLPSLISSASSFKDTNDNNSSPRLTIFCPPDEAFFSFKYSTQPPLTLLKYHVSPMMLDRTDLESSFSSSTFPIASAKIDTLLHGHPLVMTDPTSINFVKIAKWEIYNDGYIIVHGVEDFFDPAVQTLWYPWYDDDKITTTSSRSNVITKKLIDGFMLALREAYKKIWIFVALILINFYLYIVFAALRDGCIRRHRSTDNEDLPISYNDVLA